MLKSIVSSYVNYPNVIEDLNLEFTIPTYWVKGDLDNPSFFLCLLDSIEREALILVDETEDPLNFWNIYKTFPAEYLPQQKRIVILSANPLYAAAFAAQSNKLRNICPYKVIFFNKLFNQSKKSFQRYRRHDRMGGPAVYTGSQTKKRKERLRKSIEHKRFLLLSRRDSFYRRLTNYFLHKFNLFKEGYVSHNRIKETGDKKRNLDFYLYHHYFHKDILGEYDDCHRFSCQKHYLDNPSDKGKATNDYDIYKYYLDHVQFEVVTETVLFSSCMFISEKVFKPILHKKPFLLLSSVNSLKYLRELGFKTFHPIIDETYDTESNNVLRIVKLLQEVKRLCNKSPDELAYDFLKLQDVLEHNHRYFVSKNWHFNLQKNIQGYIDENIINRK